MYNSQKFLRKLLFYLNFHHYIQVCRTSCSVNANQQDRQYFDIQVTSLNWCHAYKSGVCQILQIKHSQYLYFEYYSTRHDDSFWIFPFLYLHCRPTQYPKKRQKWKKPVKSGVWEILVTARGVFVTDNENSYVYDNAYLMCWVIVSAFYKFHT